MFKRREPARSRTSPWRERRKARAASPARPCGPCV